jgi:predicted nucleic acid-binding protein
VSVAYLDSSAFIKTIVLEAESRQLATWLRNRPDRASSALLRTEAVRAVRSHGPEMIQRVREELANVELVQIDAALLDAAADLDIPVRSLDAIHLATALALGRDLAVLVTYDDRMIRGARELGIEVATP